MTEMIKFNYADLIEKLTTDREKLERSGIGHEPCIVWSTTSNIVSVGCLNTAGELATLSSRSYHVTSEEKMYIALQYPSYKWGKPSTSNNNNG